MHEEKDMSQDFTNNKMETSLVVMANTLARRRTKWSVNEQKLFFAAISRIQDMDENLWITLKTKDVLKTLHMDSHDYSSDELKQLLYELRDKSRVTFDDGEEWLDGNLIRFVKANRQTIEIRMEEEYLPLIQHLEKQFTMFRLSSIGYFKSKATITLYTDLRSRYNRLNLNQDGSYSWKYSLTQMKELFQLSETDYVRKPTKGRKGGFDTADFKRKTIDKALSEINSNPAISGMRVECEVIKDGREVLGYKFNYILVNEDGYMKQG